MNRKTCRGLFAALLLVTAMTAGASDTPRATSLIGGWRAVLREQIDRAWRETPEAFSRLDAATARVEVLDARKRGMLATVSPVFKELGPEALWPMVERLAFPSEKSRLPVSDSGRLALTVGLMEATGEQRDARLVPLWKSILEGPDTRRPVLRAAARALARMETSDAAQTLIALSKQGGRTGAAAQETMGECRRLEVARALAEALDARPAPAEARRLARALGDAGSAWAWKTSELSVRLEEGGAIRRVAAEALVRAYPDYDGDVRQALSNSVLRVDAPETPALIDAARLQAEGPRRAALDALAERLRHSPLR